MTCADKQNIANFLDLSADYLSGGYKSEPREYNFNEEPLADMPPQNSKNFSAHTGDPLEQIAAEIKACKNCRLGETRKNAVPGEGVNNPVVMVIGEGPGADEDAQGRPFVGKAGQLLDKMLASINLSRKTNCFIANVVKCRPPNNRDPYPDETAFCAGFLQRQIETLKPKFILLVGSIAATTVLKAAERVGKLRGKFTEYKTDNMAIPLLVTYHPSALLHNEDYKRPAWEDLKLLRSEIEKQES